MKTQIKTHETPPTANLTKYLRGVLAIIGITLLVQSGSAAIIIGDFSQGWDGWQSVGSGSADFTFERIQDGPWSLRTNATPPYSGWGGLQKNWDNTGQDNVTTISFNLASGGAPWIVYAYATFSNVGEQTTQIFWPSGSYNLTAATFGIPAAEFNTINGLRISMDANGATNGGGGNPMWFEIANVSLDGQVVPEPSTVVLLCVGGCSILFFRRRMA